jgi:hypothetical protein
MAPIYTRPRDSIIHPPHYAISSPTLLHIVKKNDKDNMVKAPMVTKQFIKDEVSLSLKITKIALFLFNT